MTLTTTRLSTAWHDYLKPGLILVAALLSLLAAFAVADAGQYTAEPRGKNDRATAIATAPTIPASCAHLPYPGPIFTCVNGQWLPPGHPLIPTASTPPPAPAPPSYPTDAECAGVDPYQNPQLALRCAQRPQVPGSVPTFQIGLVYAKGYSQLQARILGVSVDVDGVQVITYRWEPVSGLSGVTAERTPAGPTPWFLVIPQP